VSARIRLDGLGVRYQFDRQRRPVTPVAARLRRRVSVEWGLRGVSLRVDAGEAIALIGHNGAGKTTLLRAMAGVLAPEEGTVEVHGTVGPLLSTGGGLMPQLTGRESARLLGVLAGLSRRAAGTGLDEIAARSALGRAFARPVSTYSEGMRARLGFTVVERIDPQVLLLDEVHEALDLEFREAIEGRVESILRDGGAVVAAGHDHELLSRLCDRAILLDDGALRADGPFEEVAAGHLV
jgi:ABC-type polysaccharide/polyol phosphate transport system ATPase subunit